MGALLLDMVRLLSLTGLGSMVCGGKEGGGAMGGSGMEELLKGMNFGHALKCWTDWQGSEQFRSNASSIEGLMPAICI
jgi:hypothetical protein